MDVGKGEQKRARRQWAIEAGNRNVDIKASLEADKRRRAARKAGDLAASKKFHAEKGRPRGDAKMDLFVRLLDVVLKVEPWNSARHMRVGEAWEESRRQIPEYVKERVRTEPRLLAQQQVSRLTEQLVDPTAKTPWKYYLEVNRRVEEVAAKPAATRRYRDKFGLYQQQGHEKTGPNKSNLALVETAHTSPEQPTTAQQRQQRGHEKPGESSMLRLALSLLLSALDRVSASSAIQSTVSVGAMAHLCDRFS